MFFFFALGGNALFVPSLLTMYRPSWPVAPNTVAVCPEEILESFRGPTIRLHTSKRRPLISLVSEHTLRCHRHVISYLPPSTLRIGLPVLVMAMSEAKRLHAALCAILRAERIAPKEETILATN